MYNSKKTKINSKTKITYHSKKQFSGSVRNTTITKFVWMLIFCLVTGFAIYTLTKLVKQQQSLQTRAAVGTAEVKVFPTTTSMPPDNLFKIMVNPSKPVAFAHVELIFDKSLLNVVQINPSTVLTRIIKQSSVAEANTSGKISITYALDPAQRNTPPSGGFVLGEIRMTALNQNLNVSTAITVDQNSLQIVDMDAIALNTNAIGSSIVPSTSPTASPTTSTTTPTPGTITSSTLSFVASDDATIEAATPQSNHGKKTILEVDHSGEKDFLLKFNVSGVGERQVRSAKVRLYTVNSSRLGGIVYVATHSDWNESTVSWNTAPAIQGSPIATLGQVRLSRWVEVDVTSAITKDGTYTIRIKSTNADGADYSSRESSKQPQLILTF